MAEQTSSNLNPFNPLMRLDVAGASVVLRRQAEDFWGTETAILANLEGLSQAWFQRRREGLAAASEAAGAMCASGDPMSAFMAYQRWLAGGLARIAADGRDAQAFLMSASQAFSGAARSSALAVSDAASPTRMVPVGPATASRREAA